MFLLTPESCKWAETAFKTTLRRMLAAGTDFLCVKFPPLLPTLLTEPVSPLSSKPGFINYKQTISSLINKHTSEEENCIKQYLTS